MDGMVCLLVVLVVNSQLVRCALKADGAVLTHEAVKYWGEPDGREIIMSLLPDHVKEGAVIVEVQEIFEVVEVEGK